MYRRLSSLRYFRKLMLAADRSLLYRRLSQSAVFRIPNLRPAGEPLLYRRLSSLRSSHPEPSHPSSDEPSAVPQTALTAATEYFCKNLMQQRIVAVQYRTRNWAQYIYKERTAGRSLSHHPPDSILFVTFRLAGTVPKSILRLLRAKGVFTREKAHRSAQLESDSPERRAHSQKIREFHRQWFGKFEDILHKAKNGPTWLKDDRVAKIVADALHYRDGSIFRLDCYCIMSNHVHAVFAPFLSERELREIRLYEGVSFLSKNPPLDAIMKSLKGYTAWEANRVLGRKGTFWERESYDHVVRDDLELHRIVNYVLNNPVKAGLVKDWKEWKWSYRRTPTT